MYDIRQQARKQCTIYLPTGMLHIPLFTKLSTMTDASDRSGPIDKRQRRAPRRVCAQAHSLKASSIHSLSDEPKNRAAQTSNSAKFSAILQSNAPSHQIRASQKPSNMATILFPQRKPLTPSQISSAMEAALAVQRRVVTFGKRPFAAGGGGEDSG
ncbi:hypothetical protein GE09DRAFT_322794 [Coniochaeta sp. 2T2.1]|nr:hypothetical protein GE09DRAFT_322794 [Coniochaeta sp. 2T2.1]